MVKSTFKFLMFLTTVICIIMFTSTGDEIGIKAAALAESGQCGDNVFWEYNAKSGAVAIRGNGQMYEYFEDNSVFYQSDIKKITISDGVTSIGACAFAYCTNLKSVSFPKSLKSIGRSAFEGCASLKSVDIPDSVTNMGNYCFAACEKMDKINLSESLTNINYGSFCSTAIKSIDIPNGVASIAGMAFYNCSKLTKVSIPDSVIYIGEAAFFQCKDLSNIKLPFKISRIERETFSGCEKIKKIVIPYNVTFIDLCAFDSCTELEELVISNPNCEITDSNKYGGWLTFTILADENSAVKEYIDNDHNNGLDFRKIQHTYKSTVVAKATTSKNGKLKKVCKECGKETTSSIAKIKSVNLSKRSYVYDGKEKKPSVTVKDSNGKKLTLNTDYTVTYSGKRIAVGTYKVTVKFKGKYSGSKTLEFKIVIGKVSGIKSTINGKDVKISWSKVAGATGYQVLEYDKAKKKYKELGKFGKNSITNSLSDQKITLKIRAYYIDKSGKTHYGSYSDPTSIKI